MEENKSSEHINGDEIVLQVGAGKNAQQYDNNGKPASPNQQKNYNKQELTANIERSSPEYESRSSSSAKKDKVDNELIESAKAEIHEVMEENQRLKTYLDRVLKDYRNLQMQYRDVIKQEALKSPSVTTTISADDTRNYHHDQVEEPELISLSLGRGSSDTMRDDPPRKNGKVDTKGLTLGLDCKMEDFHTQLEPKSLDPSPENSVEEVKEQAGETWTPNNKTTKNARDEGDDEISPQNPAKKARVSVRVRCDTPTMNDGCQWRKYGQKIAKGNPCPRAYYRCTVAPQCPVRKQVQRCAEDMSILITTYEGTHNHPLPVSAKAMASTTSAAASMLLSGSSTSASGPSSSSSTSAAMTSANINGLNFYLCDNSRPKPFYLPNSSISSSSSYPTITLDLTSSSSSSSASHFNRLPSLPPRYSTTNLNFSSLESNALPISWSNGVLTSYASHQPLNTNQTTSNSLNFGGHENNFHSYLKPNNQQSLAPDTIEAATKAIASDPSFRSALAAAISSLISPGAASTTTATTTNTPGYNLSIRDKASQNINSSTEPFPILSSFPSTSNNVNKCTPSYLNKSSSTSSSSTQPGNLMFLSPSFPFSNSRSKSNSPGDSRDHKVV